MNFRGMLTRLYIFGPAGSNIADETLHASEKKLQGKSWKRKIKDVALRIGNKTKDVALTVGTLGIYANNKAYDEDARRWKEFLIEQGYDETSLRTNYDIFQTAKRYVDEGYKQKPVETEEQTVLIETREEKRSWRSKVKDVALTIGNLGIYANNKAYDEDARRWKEFLIGKGYKAERLRTNYDIFQAAKRYVEENPEEYLSYF
jgi:hypothetical protein